MRVSVAESARELAKTVDVREVATRVTEEIMAAVWKHRDEPGFYELVDRSVYSNIEAIFETLRSRRSIDDPPPTPALDFADVSAQVGIPAIELERAYRVGVASLWSQWFDRASDHAAQTGQPLGELVRGPSLTFLDYVDHTLVAVVERADAMRLELQRTESQLRRVLLLRILEGSATEAGPELDRRLDYHTGDVHVALLAQCPDPATLRSEVQAFQSAADARGTLVLQNSASSWFVWFGRPAGFGSKQLSGLRRASTQSSLTVAVGEPAAGIDGLRQTYEQAFETGHLQHALGPARHRSIWAADVRLELLLLTDPLRARNFVEAELGPLANDDTVANRLRETLLAWLATGSVVSAAALLEVHENTIRNRLRQAEDMLGVVVHQRRIELQVALRIARVLSASEHPDAQFASGRKQKLLVSDDEWLRGSSA